MTSEQVGIKPPGRIGREPLNLPVADLSTRDAFLIISSELAQLRNPYRPHIGYWRLSSSIDELPGELAKVAIMLGLKDNVRLHIHTSVQLQSSKEPDYDSVNEIAVWFFGRGCRLTYRYDNRSWRFGRRDPYHRMSLNYEGVDSNCSRCPETERQTKLLKEMGVFRDREKALRGLCELLNRSRLVV